jgi:polyphosphate kinase
VEILFPVESPEHIRYLRDEVISHYLDENLRAWVLQPDGAYQRTKPNSGDPGLDIQKFLMAKS